MKILLFEDTETQADHVLAALRSIVGKGDTIEIFESHDLSDDKTYEERLRNELRDSRYSDTTLIVADRDLSKTKKYTGLSESIVRRVADQLAIPECFYARNAADTELVRADEREAFIAVSIKEGFDNCAKQLLAIAKGFKELRSKLGANRLISSKQSAGKTLAKILGKDEYADKIALYASGDRNRPGHVLNMIGDNANEQLNRLTCLFGYWLWDSVLQYPGVVVNEIAAASYLNIKAETFNTESIRNVFEDALYKGPFAEALSPLWWRGMLDDMVATGQFKDGRDLAIKRLGTETSPSECCEDPSIPAGYYCMLSKKPVSLKNSRPGLAWFPRGADLARVSRSRFEELGPWL